MEKLQEGVDLALRNARRLAVAATNAVDANDPHTAAVLLYQAAEEIGKAKLLSNHATAAKPLASTRLRDHGKKFSLALDIVPSDCLELWGPAFDPRMFQANAFQTRPIKVDWQRRQASLYANWDESSGTWIAAVTPEAGVVRASSIRMIAFIDGALVVGLP